MQQKQLIQEDSMRTGVDCFFFIELIINYIVYLS